MDEYRSTTARGWDGVVAIKLTQQSSDMQPGTLKMFRVPPGSMDGLKTAPHCHTRCGELLPWKWTAHALLSTRTAIFAISGQITTTVDNLTQIIPFCPPPPPQPFFHTHHLSLSLFSLSTILLRSPRTLLWTSSWNSCRSAVSLMKRLTAALSLSLPPPPPPPLYLSLERNSLHTHIFGCWRYIHLCLPFAKCLLQQLASFVSWCVLFTTTTMASFG